MAKSNAQRQREWRLRQKNKELCTYGGCENKAPMPHSLCDKHREEAREIRRGQVRQLRVEIEALRLENAELRGRLAELERRYAEASESSQILLRYSQLQRMYAELGGAVIAEPAWWIGPNYPTIWSTSSRKPTKTPPLRRRHDRAGLVMRQMRR